MEVFGKPEEWECMPNETVAIQTFGEFTNILYYIEACLNSRPLVSLSNNQEEIEALALSLFNSTND